MDNFNFTYILVILFFIILISIQYTLNLILREIREIRRYLSREKEMDKIYHRKAEQ